MSPLQVSIVLSDPWELGEALNWEPLNGRLLRMETSEHGGRALVELEKPIAYLGSDCRFVVASPRHEGEEIASVRRRKSVACAFTGISEADAGLDGVPDTLTWRGGIAFIGDIKLKSESE